jgi:F0F1-type ATP synthase membrane subunit b/b'
MDPLTMLGAWAGALLAIVALMRLLYHAFVKAVKVAIREELGRVWKDQDEIEQRLSALELSMQFVRQQLEDLRAMMQAHVDKP